LKTAEQRAKTAFGDQARRLLMRRKRAEAAAKAGADLVKAQVADGRSGRDESGAAHTERAFSSMAAHRPWFKHAIYAPATHRILGA